MFQESSIVDMIDLVLYFNELATDAVSKGVNIQDVIASKAKYRISEVKTAQEHKELLQEVKTEMKTEMDDLVKQYQ